MKSDITSLNFVDHYASLGEAFSLPVTPAHLDQPKLCHLNPRVCAQLNLDAAQTPTQQWFALAFGQLGLAQQGSPRASLYAGHQFGHWVPQLGDGRAMILGQVKTSGGLLEIQNKGAGPTPFSRGSDGRAVLRSSIREYLCSEYMHQLGIPTTGALALISSKTPVYREAVESAAMLLRTAPSHIRFGTFQVFAHRQQLSELKTLADFVIEHHYPDCQRHEKPYLCLYEQIIERTAQLIAQWQCAGFCHGVMNTDNMSILGVTLDYGPYAFMEAYVPDFVCNTSDYEGRYAYNQQPNVALWNLAQLGNSLLSLIPLSEAQAALERFPQHYSAYFRAHMAAKLGLKLLGDPASTQRIAQLIDNWLALLQTHRVDFSQSFYLLAQTRFDQKRSFEPLRQIFLDHQAFDTWQNEYREICSDASLDPEAVQHECRAHNPKYVLRNYMAQEAIEAAERGDFRVLNSLFEVISAPFAAHPEHQAWSQPAPRDARFYCVSCSS